ncbi:MAG TPA: site-specific integrase [Gemmata sp.]
MGRVFQPTYTKPDGNGGRVRVTVKDWYCEWTDATGTQRNQRIGTKKAAQAALARFEDLATRHRAGLPDPAGDAIKRNRPVAELLTEYLDELRNRDRSDAYIKGVERHLNALAPALRWYAWTDVTGPPLTKFVQRLRTGKHSVSPATANGYIRSAKGFAGWYADLIEAANPLRSVRLLNEQVERRRSRRVLDDAEFAKFLRAAEECPPRHNAFFPGPVRAALYRVAAFTGLRLSELASLTPSHFDLKAAVPVVTVEAADTKGKREEPIPLHPNLATFLMTFLAGRAPSALLWPGRWAKDRRHVRWVERDAARAGLGPGVTFHSLRRKFVSDLIRAGADIDEVRRLARHKSAKTTLDHYAETKLGKLHQAVSRLKPLA